MSEVLCLGEFVAQTFLMAVEHDVVGTYAAWYLPFVHEHDGLPLRVAHHKVAEEGDVDFAVLFHEQTNDGGVVFFTHAVGEEVGSRGVEYGGQQTVLPVVVVGESAK